ncbi:hypothetical protein GCM10009000_090620 [Halobacterium noricense]|jgi:hypothetical protein
MNRHSAGDDREGDVEDGDRPVVPEGVLCGIEDITDGNTASKEDLAAVLKY